MLERLVNKVSLYIVSSNDNQRNGIKYIEMNFKRKPAFKNEKRCGVKNKRQNERKNVMI